LILRSLRVSISSIKWLKLGI